MEGGFEFIGGVRPGVGGGGGVCGVAELLPLGVGQVGDFEDGVGHGLGVFRGDEFAVAVVEEGGGGAGGGSDDGGSAGHGFEDGEAEAFDAGGEEPGVAVGVQLGDEGLFGAEGPVGVGGEGHFGEDFVGAEGEDFEVGELLAGEVEGLDGDVGAFEFGGGVHEADGGGGLFAARGGGEVFCVEGVGDEGGVGVVELCACEFFEPGGDDDFFHGESPGGVDAVFGLVPHVGFVVLDEVDFCAFGGGEGGGPLGGFPPGGDEDVGVGEVFGADGAGVGELDAGEAAGAGGEGEAVEVGGAFVVIDGEFSGVFEGAPDFAEGGFWVLRLDGEEGVAAVGELLGVAGDDAAAAGAGIGGE